MAIPSWLRMSGLIRERSPPWAEGEDELQTIARKEGRLMWAWVVIGFCYLALLGLILAFFKGASMANERYDRMTGKPDMKVADELLKELQEMKAREYRVKEWSECRASEIEMRTREKVRKKAEQTKHDQEIHRLYEERSSVRSLQESDQEG